MKSQKRGWWHLFLMGRCSVALRRHFFWWGKQLMKQTPESRGQLQLIIQPDRFSKRAGWGYVISLFWTRVKALRMSESSILELRLHILESYCLYFENHQFKFRIKFLKLIFLSFNKTWTSSYHFAFNFCLPSKYFHNGCSLIPMLLNSIFFKKIFS